MQKRKIKTAGEVINADMIERAEKAVAKLSAEYTQWATEDIAKLREILQAIRQNPASRDTRFQEIYATVHDMRGQGATFGFPLITRIAASLSTYLKQPDAGDTALGTIQVHIDTLAAVIEGQVTDDLSLAAAKIIDTLKSATGKPLA